MYAPALQSLPSGNVQNFYEAGDTVCFPYSDGESKFIPLGTFYMNAW